MTTTTRAAVRAARTDDTPLRVASLLRGLAVAYPVALSAVAAAFWRYGEDHSVVTMALYLPRVIFALPLALIVPALGWTRSWWLLGLQAISLSIVLVPLMGLQVALPRRTDGVKSIRILSYNTFHGRRGSEVIRGEIVAEAPDVVLLQATASRTSDYLRQHPIHGYTVHRASEFWLATRFPLVDVHEPADLPDTPPIRARFIRYTILTPLGPLDVFSVHPESPRRAAESLRGRGFLRELLAGELLDFDAAKVEANTYVRQRQVEAVSEHARRARNPVIIAGDMNLPGLSRIYARYLGGYQDAFAEVGHGFGYTFPSHRALPWLRLDRILAGPELRFLQFRVTGGRGSDHLAVVADLTRRN